MIIPLYIPPRQISVIGLMEQMKSLLEGYMSRMEPESKITWKQSLRPVGSSLI